MNFIRRHLVGNKGTHFAIVSMGRTGSTLLANLLNSHPHIECRGELFHPIMGNYKNFSLPPSKFLRRHAYETRLPIRGFKMPWDWIPLYPSVFDYFAAQNYRIIRLVRENALEQFLSAKLARLNNSWDSLEVYKEQRISIHPLELMAYIGERLMIEVALDGFCKGLPSYHISFEKLFDKEKQAGLLAFLEASISPLSTSTIASRTIPLHEAITNFDELANFYANTDYAQWFQRAEASVRQCDV